MQGSENAMTGLIRTITEWPSGAHKVVSYSQQQNMINGNPQSDEY